MLKRKELTTTFRGNNQFPIYNWFHFTEAFSRELVQNLFLKYFSDVKKPKEITVFDPFSGIGTTLLAAKEFGFNSIGTEISPLMYLFAQSKTINYNLEELDLEKERIVEEFVGYNKEIEIKEEEKWLRKHFYSENLRDLFIFREIINKIKKEDLGIFFNALYIKTAQVVTRSEKQGSCLRRRKIRKLNTLKIFERTFKEFMKDLKKTQKKYKMLENPEPKIYNDSVLELDKYVKPNSVDIIITSPPYLNKTEYTKRFGIEYTLLGKEGNLKIHLGVHGTKIKNTQNYLYKAYFKGILSKIEAEDYKLDIEGYNFDNYFIDLEDYIKKATKTLKKGGIFVNVIAGGCFKDFSIDITDYMKALYEANGLKIEEIIINREIQCHRDRTIKTGKINEFTIIGRK
jgi:DNA modification methylase